MNKIQEIPQVQTQIISLPRSLSPLFLIFFEPFMDYLDFMRHYVVLDAPHRENREIEIYITYVYMYRSV